MTEHPQHHFPWRVTALVAVLVIVATTVAGIVLSRNSVEQVSPAPSVSASASSVPQPQPLPLDERRQLTLLLQVHDKATGIASSVLIGAAGGTGFVSELLLPRDLLLPTSPAVRLRDTNGPRGPVSAQDPLQVLLGIQVNAAIDLDRLAWAGLIDAGGALVDPEKGQDASAFPLVLDRVLTSLPKDERTIGQLLTSLGSMAPTSVTNEDASHLLHLIAEGLRAQPSRRAVLPATYVRGGARPVAVMDADAAEPVLTDLFPQADLQPGHPGTPRVVLEQAGATLGRIGLARQALFRAGMGVLVRPAEPASLTSVLIPVESAAARRIGTDAAAALGLPPTVVVVDPSGDAVVDVRIVLGADFAPV